MRRILGALVSLMLLWGGEPSSSDPTVPHVAVSADNGCLSLDRDRNGAPTFATTDRTPGTCATSRLPLLRDTALGFGKLSGDLELSNLDVGHMTAQEVKIKFGLTRDLVAGLGATLEGSFGRLLGSITPTFDEQLHAALAHPLDARWETGLEGRLAALAGIGPTQLTERTGLIFLRSRYTLATSHGDLQQIVFKLSADAGQSTQFGAARHQRADLRYEYHHDSNIVSIGLNASETEPNVGADAPAFRVDLRATRRF